MLNMLKYIKFWQTIILLLQQLFGDASVAARCNQRQRKSILRLYNIIFASANLMQHMSLRARVRMHALCVYTVHLYNVFRQHTKNNNNIMCKFSCAAFLHRVFLSVSSTASFSLCLSALFRWPIHLLCNLFCIGVPYILCGTLGRWNSFIK